jgi:hypothetical protein
VSEYIKFLEPVAVKAHYSHGIAGRLPNGNYKALSGSPVDASEITDPESLKRLEKAEKVARAHLEAKKGADVYDETEFQEGDYAIDRDGERWEYEGKYGMFYDEYSSVSWRALANLGRCIFYRPRKEVVTVEFGNHKFMKNCGEWMGDCGQHLPWPAHPLLDIIVEQRARIAELEGRK